MMDWVRVECVLMNYDLSSTNTVQLAQIASDGLLVLVAEPIIVPSSANVSSESNYVMCIYCILTLYTIIILISVSLSISFSVIHDLYHLCIIIGGGFCDADVTFGALIEYLWPETQAGDLATLPCEFGPSVDGGMATRVCNSETARWQLISFTECLSGLFAH